LDAGILALGTVAAHRATCRGERSVDGVGIDSPIFDVNLRGTHAAHMVMRKRFSDARLDGFAAAKRIYEDAPWLQAERPRLPRGIFYLRV
jgi:hypothetical protein